MRRTQTRKALSLLLAMTSFVAGQSRAQQPAQSSTVPVADPNAGPSEASEARGEPGHSLQNSIDATESWEPPPPPRKMVRFNEYRGPYITARYGAGLLLEHGAFAQDTISKEQIVMHPEERLRDFRFILGGKIAPRMERSLTWSAGIMYDGPNHRWLVRQTGVMIAVPELWGNFFVGRSKEGFSLLKIMVGYDGWTFERQEISDATIPILADGFKWLGYSPKYHFLWNAGYFNDVLSHEQTFSTYSSQEVGRFVWLPIHSDKEDKVLNLGVAYRYGKPENNKLQLKSRPEAFTRHISSIQARFPPIRPGCWAMKPIIAKIDGYSGVNIGGCMSRPQARIILCSTGEMLSQPISSMMPRAFTTLQEDFSGQSLPSVPYSRAVRVHGNLCFDTPISILTIRGCREGSSAGLRLWSTGTCQTTCV